MQGLKMGYRFSPKDEELIVILQKKLKGELVSHNYVFEYNIYYDKEPWMIFDKTLKKTYYVFTKLKRKSKSRIKRMVGCGTWKGEQPGEPIFNHANKHIGFMKLFTFVEKERSSSSTKGTNGQWIMREFSIGESDDYVLCKIRNKNTDKLEAECNPQLHAIVKQFDKCNLRNLGSEEENQAQKKIKLGNNIAAQLSINPSMVITSSTEQSQFDAVEAPYMPIHDIATNQDYYAQSSGGNIVVAEQSNESHLLGVPIKSSSIDSIFDELPDKYFESTPHISNVEDINIGDYLDYSMPEFLFDSPDAFDPMFTSPMNQQLPIL